MSLGPFPLTPALSPSSELAGSVATSPRRRGPWQAERCRHLSRLSAVPLHPFRPAHNHHRAGMRQRDLLQLRSPEDGGQSEPGGILALPPARASAHWRDGRRL